MKNRIAGVLLFFVLPGGLAAQQVVNCGWVTNANGERYVWECGRKDVFRKPDGTLYECVCNCALSNPNDCRPLSSSSSSGGGFQGAASTQAMIFQSAFAPAIDNFFKWLFSSGSPQKKSKTAQNKQQQEDDNYKKQHEEYMARLQAQLKDARDEYNKLMASQAKEQKQVVVNEFKDRFAVSEATKAVKQMNCAAFASVQVTEQKLASLRGQFKGLKEPEEELASLMDFANGNTKGCPPIAVKIPEVNAQQTVSFQQMYYNYVLYRSDSVQRKIDTLKQAKVENDKAIAERKQKVEQAKKQIEESKKPEAQAAGDDKLLKDALKELELANSELQNAERTEEKLKADILEKEKTVAALDKMRSVYDVENIKQP